MPKHGVIIYLGQLLPVASSGVPGDGAGHPCSCLPCSEWGLPSQLITQLLVVSYTTFAPLPPSDVESAKQLQVWCDEATKKQRWCCGETVLKTTNLLREGAVFFCGTFPRSPSLGVIQHPALWSPDFPRPEGRNHLTHFHSSGSEYPIRLKTSSQRGSKTGSLALR